MSLKPTPYATPNVTPAPVHSMTNRGARKSGRKLQTPVVASNPSPPLLRVRLSRPRSACSSGRFITPQVSPTLRMRLPESEPPSTQENLMAERPKRIKASEWSFGLGLRESREHPCPGCHGIRKPCSVCNGYRIDPAWIIVVPDPEVPHGE